jgi:transposase
VAAMILNGLGFIDDRLYLFPQFLANKRVDKLLGAKLCAADFNDDVLGRGLDALYGYGITQLFSVEPQVAGFMIQAKLIPSEEKLSRLRAQKGRFIVSVLLEQIIGYFGEQAQQIYGIKPSCEQV